MSLSSQTARAVSRLVSSRGLRDARRSAAALGRRIKGETVTVLYVHDAADPYSHLAAQALAPLLARYDLQLEIRLAGPPNDGAAPERARLEAWSRRDAAQVATARRMSFPEHAAGPATEAVSLAERALVAALEAGAFVKRAPEVGAALWAGERIAGPLAEPAVAEARKVEGSAERARLGHYLGAAFHLDGEWFWGVDRLHYLEQRLGDLGRDRTPGAPPLLPPLDEGRLTPPEPTGARRTVSLFTSLRSPYAYLATKRAIRLAERWGAELDVRPILPMVMRGLPVPRSKQIYIVRDVKREADRWGEPFGDIADPVGPGAERGLAVLHHALPRGQGPVFLESFLRGAFAEGIDAASDRGLDQMAERAGITAVEVRAALADPSWRERAEANRAALFERGLWGAPTMQVDGGPAVWGQDRLWAVERDLARLATAP